MAPCARRGVGAEPHTYVHGAQPRHRPTPANTPGASVWLAYPAEARVPGEASGAARGLHRRPADSGSSGVSGQGPARRLTEKDGDLPAGQGMEGGTRARGDLHAAASPTGSVALVLHWTP
jgi:hypothetical protein